MKHSHQVQVALAIPAFSIPRFMIASLLSGAFILSAGTVLADGNDHKGYGHDPKSHLEHLTKQLELSQEQQDKILPIIEDKHQKMEGLHNQMKQIREEAMGKIEAELTPDQQKKWHEMQEERQEKMKEYRDKHGKGHGKGKHGKGEGHE